MCPTCLAYFHVSEVHAQKHVLKTAARSVKESNFNFILKLTSSHESLLTGAHSLERSHFLFLLVLYSTCLHVLTSRKVKQNTESRWESGPSKFRENYNVLQPYNRYRQLWRTFEYFLHPKPNNRNYLSADYCNRNFASYGPKASRKEDFVQSLSLFSRPAHNSNHRLSHRQSDSLRVIAALSHRLWSQSNKKLRTRKRKNWGYKKNFRRKNAAGRDRVCPFCRNLTTFTTLIRSTTAVRLVCRPSPKHRNEDSEPRIDAK